MKIKVAQSALLSGLQVVQNVVGSRPSLPILSNLLVTATKEGGLTLSTTDLDVSIRTRVEATVDRPGATTLPAKRLSGIIRELAAGEIEIDVDDKDAADVTSGSSYFRIMGLSEDEFPPIPKAEGKFTYHLDQGVFREMLRKTAYAASTDESRFVLNGVLLSFKNGKLTVVATDGRRLALVENEVEFPKGSEQEMILPTKAVNELMHTLADEGVLNIVYQTNQAIFEYGNTMLASKLVDGNYPNYRQVIPTQSEQRVVIERESLLTALKRVYLLATDKTSSAKLTFAKNKLVVSISAQDVGEARETVPVKYNGKELTAAFNPDYLMDPLRTLNNDEIYMELSDELSPGVVKCDIPFLYVLMPMRVG